MGCTLSGGLKSAQLIINLLTISLIVLGSDFPLQSLLQLSIANVIFCVIIMLIRSRQNDQNSYRGLGQLEFGLYSVSTYLYIYFSSRINEISGFRTFNFAMAFGLLNAALYASAAFDKFATHFMSIDNKSTCNDPRSKQAPNQNHPPPA